MSLYHEYATAKKTIKTQTAILRDLEPRVFTFVKRATDETVVNEEGTFKIIVTPHYEFSPKVTHLEERLRTLRSFEIQNSIAKPVRVEYLRYTDK
jgi:hypothetical protein